MRYNFIVDWHTLLINCNRSKSKLEVPAVGEPIDAPPAYGEHLDQIQVSQDGFSTHAKLTGELPRNFNVVVCSD